MQSRRAAAAALLLATAAPSAGQVPGYQRWPPPEFDRGFHKTEDGRLHYVSVGSARASQCLLMLHGNPRSTDEFTEIMLSSVCAGRFCVAVDVLGAGHSDDARRDNITMVEYAAHLKGLLAGLGVQRCSPFGSYTGATLGAVFATEYPSMVDYAVLNGLVYYLDSTVQQVSQYIQYTRGFVPAANGSHLLWVWNQRSYAPDPSNPNPWLKERTKLDFIRELPTQWPIMQMNLDVVRYDTGDLLKRVASFTKPMLLMYGGEMVKEWSLCPPCFNMTEAIKELTAAFPADHKPTVHYIDGATEAAMNENATAVEKVVSAWLPPV